MKEPINCGEYVSCYDCYEANTETVICPEFQLTILPTDKQTFKTSKEEPDDIYFS